ncbi:MAG: hypothetical protein FWD05_11355 [Oscillospiraceae bacterium]|nr:hypothetical protein [Oscillospiraceae bacterium]
MSTKQKKIRLTCYEEDLVIKSLNTVRTDLINDNKCDKDVSDVMLKIMRSKQRKARTRNETR